MERYGVDNVALLCPMRDTKDGQYKCVSNEMNKILQGIVNPKNEEKKCVTLSKTLYIIGDRVMQCKNTKDASNGDIGTLVAIEESDTGYVLTVKWENGVTSKLTRDDMENITHAYAMTIHKSQGSEYDCVIIPILKNQYGPLMRRNLLYTAVTRAKKEVILVGDIGTIYACIETEDTPRKTALGSRIIYNARKKGIVDGDNKVIPEPMAEQENDCIPNDYPDDYPEPTPPEQEEFEMMDVAQEDDFSLSIDDLI